MGFGTYESLQLGLPIPHGLLHHATNMRRSVDVLLGEHVPQRARLLIYYQDMEVLVGHGAMVAIDLVVDIAYLLNNDPRVSGPEALSGLVVLDGGALAARTRDMIAMRSRGLN